jgi:hypothetical protein
MHKFEVGDKVVAINAVWCKRIGTIVPMETWTNNSFVRWDYIVRFDDATYDSELFGFYENELEIYKHKFKIGDKVKIKQETSYSFGGMVGEIVVKDKVKLFDYAVKFDFDNDQIGFNSYELELIDSVDENTNNEVVNKSYSIGTKVKIVNTDNILFRDKTGIIDSEFNPEPLLYDYRVDFDGYGFMYFNTEELEVIDDHIETDLEYHQRMYPTIITTQMTKNNHPLSRFQRAK